MRANSQGAFGRWAALPLGLLVGATSLGGIALPSAYAQETASWAAQGVGQDWVNLVVIAPCLLLAGMLALRGSPLARLALGGLYAYSLYSFVIYALGMHFNVLYFGYCAVLGLSFFATVAWTMELSREDVRRWYSPRAPVRLAGVFLLVQAVLFAGMWLAEDIPAVLSGRAPASLAEVGLIINPVHVLDLSIALPALALAGVALLRGRALGYVLAPMMLGFACWMSLAIAGMVVSLFLRGLSANLTLSGVFVTLALGSAGLLGLLVRGTRSPGRSPARGPLEA
jgi:hypothetical protein